MSSNVLRSMTGGLGSRGSCDPEGYDEGSGHLLRRECHRHLDVLVVERGPQRILKNEVVGEFGALPDVADRVRCHGHGLCPACEGYLALAAEDALGGQDEALEAGAAQAVHSKRRGFLGDAGPEADVAREVGSVDGGLGDVAEVNVLDLVRVDVGLRDSGLCGDDAEVCGWAGRRIAHGESRFDVGRC